MPVATNESSTIPQPRAMVRRKPAPSIVLDARYPCPDPEDPFAPLSVLRTRTASTLGLLSFAGDSTSHLPILPYTGGNPFPQDPYQITPPTSPIITSSSSSSPTKFVRTFSSRSTFDISPNFHDASETARKPQRRRSRSAISRKEARSSTCSALPGTSPYGHTNLQAYVLASSRLPSPPYSAEPFGMQQTQPAHGSVLSLPITRHDSAPVLSLMSTAKKSTFTAEPVNTSRSRVKKLARLLPKRTRSGLSLAEFSSEKTNANEKHRHFKFPLSTVAPVSPSERSFKDKHVPEENMFRPRRKSSTLNFPVLVAANMQSLDVSDPSTGTSIYESPAYELGYISNPSSTTLHSPSIISTMPHISEPAPLTPKKKRPQTMQLQQRVVDLTESLQHDKQAMRPSTAPSGFPLSFDENALPTRRQLLDAASCNVVAENGLRVPFGDLFQGQKTVVIFIRHFW